MRQRLILDVWPNVADHLFIFYWQKVFLLSKKSLSRDQAVTTSGIISFQRVSLLQVSISYLISLRYHYGMHTPCMYRKLAFSEITGTQVVFLREEKDENEKNIPENDSYVSRKSDEKIGVTKCENTEGLIV